MRRNNVGGILALAVLGGYVLFRNRDRIRAYLERQGINLPHRDELIDRIRDTANRVVSQLKEQSDEVLKQAG